MKLRVISWNVQFASVQRAVAQAEYLRALQPELVLLQEINAASLDAYRTVSGLVWLTCSRSADLHGVERARRPAAAVGGRDVELVDVLPRLADAPLPERMHIATIGVGGSRFVAASYYAPPGVTFRYKKVENALAFLAWIQRTAGPILVGADANSPKIDHPDFASTRSWWHTGTRMMHGRPGDDTLWGPSLQHNLEDALRLWLKTHPAEFAELVAKRPTGPLAVSHWTGKRRLAPEAGVARRYDSIWVSGEFSVNSIQYLTEAMPGLSDHAPVVVDLELGPHRGAPGVPIAGRVG